MALNPLVAGRIECDGTREEEGCQGIIQLVLGALVSEGLDCKLRLGPPVHWRGTSRDSFPLVTLASRATAALNCSAAFTDAGTLVKAPPPPFFAEVCRDPCGSSRELMIAIQTFTSGNQKPVRIRRVYCVYPYPYPYPYFNNTPLFLTYHVT